MAQHDYVIANDTAASVRADINDALAAIASNNSGASEPSTTYANQWWYDSTNDILKIRNEADTAWINILSLDQGNGVSIPELQVGLVAPFAFTTPPSGWLECDGAAISRTAYSNLFTAIGTTFGSGDGSTTFDLPDLRGEFLRGWDNGRGVDGSRTFGSSQLDAMQGHRHEIVTVGGAAVAASNFVGDSFNALPGFRGTGANDNARTMKTDGTNGTPRIGSETRPRNVALMYCIKF